MVDKKIASNSEKRDSWRNVPLLKPNARERFKFFNDVMRGLVLVHRGDIDGLLAIAVMEQVN